MHEYELWEAISRQATPSQVQAYVASHVTRNAEGVCLLEGKTSLYWAFIGLTLHKAGHLTTAAVCAEIVRALETLQQRRD